MASLKELQEKARAQVQSIEAAFRTGTTPGNRFADGVTNTVGSWRFILMQSSILAVWMLWNSLPSTPFHFDTPPFIGLNLLLSFQAAYTAPFIMMSQNRVSAKDRVYAETDFVTNQLAQSEIDEMHDHLDELVETGRDSRQLLQETATIRQQLQAITDRLARLEDRLPKA